MWQNRIFGYLAIMALPFMLRANLAPEEAQQVASFMQHQIQYFQAYHPWLENVVLGSQEMDFAVEGLFPDTGTERNTYLRGKEKLRSLLAVAPSESEGEWQILLDQYVHLSDRLDHTLELIQLHLARRKYLEDGGRYLNGALHQVLIMVEDLRSLQQELDYELSLLGIRNGDMEATRSVEALLPMLEASREILNGMRQEEITQVRQGYNRLKGQLIRLNALESTLLSGLKARPGSSADPQHQWRTVIGAAENLLARTEAFLAGGTIPVSHRALGRGYYHYNHQMNPGFSAPGQGLVASYNRLIALAGVSVLPQAGELFWVKLLPPPEEPEETIVVTPPDAPVTLSGAAHQNLVFLVDVSSSMNEPGRLPLFQETMKRLVGELRPQDYISMVTFAGEANVVLPPTTGREANAIVSATTHLAGHGKTMIYPGFEAGYEAAAQHFNPACNNRIIIITDGEFDIEPQLLQLIEAKAYQGVYLTILAVGDLEPRMAYRLTRLAEVGQGRLGWLQPDRAMEQLIQEVQAE